jgi:hypothetical protein
MPMIPGTIDLGKFRVVYEEERESGSDESDGYLLQQRAIIRWNEPLVKVDQPDDHAVYCDDENFTKQAGKSLAIAIFHRFHRFLHVQPTETVCCQS